MGRGGGGRGGGKSVIINARANKIRKKYVGVESLTFKCLIFTH